MAVAAAKIRSTEVALAVCEGLFNVCGAGATVAKYDLDRHWRNARTMSLHDPLEWKYAELGRHVLSGWDPPFGINQ